MKMILVVFLTLFIANTALGFDRSYKEWGEILKNYVKKENSDTYFQYLELKKNNNDIKKLDLVLDSFSQVTTDQYSSWNREEKLVFLFNSYNAFTVKMILNNHSEKKRLKSIRDIGSLLKNTWKIKFFNFLGEKSHLDRIEHEIARKQFDEPRLHVAFNCASRGCPNLLNRPFVANAFDKQLDEASHDFMNNRSKNYFDSKSSTLYLSSIFKWYGDDFKKGEKFKSVESFVAKYMDLSPADKELVINKKAKISYLDYDWGLNEL